MRLYCHSYRPTLQGRPKPGLQRRLLTAACYRYTKKTTVSAVYFVFYCVGNIIGPQTFQAKDAPLYRPAEIAIIVVLAVCLLDMVAMYAILRRRNQQKRLQREQATYEKQAGSEFWDLTDMENPEFEYSL